MTRTVTITFDDNTSHIYQNVPDDATPESVSSRASQDFKDKNISNIDGGRKKSTVEKVVSSASDLIRGPVESAMSMASYLPAAVFGHANALTWDAENQLRKWQGAPPIDPINIPGTNNPAKTSREFSQGVKEQYTYQPRTTTGQNINYILGLVPGKVSEAVTYLGDKAGLPTSVTDIGAEAASFVIPAKGAKVVATQGWRGVKAVPKVVDKAKEATGWTEKQLQTAAPVTFANKFKDKIEKDLELGNISLAEADLKKYAANKIRGMSFKKLQDYLRDGEGVQILKELTPTVKSGAAQGALESFKSLGRYGPLPPIAGLGLGVMFPNVGATVAAGVGANAIRGAYKGAKGKAQFETLKTPLEPGQTFTDIPSEAGGRGVRLLRHPLDPNSKNRPGPAGPTSPAGGPAPTVADVITNVDPGLFDSSAVFAAKEASIAQRRAERAATAETNRVETTLRKIEEQKLVEREQAGKQAEMERVASEQADARAAAAAKQEQFEKQAALDRTAELEKTRAERDANSERLKRRVEQLMAELAAKKAAAVAPVAPKSVAELVQSKVKTEAPRLLTYAEEAKQIIKDIKSANATRVPRSVGDLSNQMLDIQMARKNITKTYRDSLEMEYRSREKLTAEQYEALNKGNMPKSNTSPNAGKTRVPTMAEAIEMVKKLRE